MNTLVYTSTTGEAPVDTRPEADTFDPQNEQMWFEWCQPCGRCTDHVGEHDYLVMIGWAEYDTSSDRYEANLVVRCTDKYDRTRAGEMAEMETAFYSAFHADV